MALPDRVQAIKWERPSEGGSETDDVPTEIDVHEDALDARGLFLQSETGPADNEVLVSRDADGNMTFQDQANVVPLTLSDLAAGGGGGLTPETHRLLDQLVHELDESHFEEYLYSGSLVTGSIVWTDSGKTLRIRDYAYTYSGSKIATETVRQYNAAGTVVETLVYTYSYSGTKVSSVSCVRT
jgi:hypothetical protein